MIFRYYLKTLVLLLSFINGNSFQSQFNICKPMKSSKISLKMNNLNRSDFNNIALGFLSLSIQNIAINKFLIKSMLSENNQKDIFKRTSNSVCFISTEYSNIASNYNINTEDLPKGVGTGFIWDNQGHIVTNFHVINKVDSAKVIINNRTYDAKITGIEPEKDIAVLKIDKQISVIPIPLGNINDITIGQYAYAIGNPFGQDHTFTMGIISGKNREITSPTGKKIKGIIQTDAAINPGNSGGPLLNSKGEIIGMNTASFGTGVSSGVGFAIPINIISKVVNEIITNGGVQKAIIGVSFLERLPTSFESKELGIPEIKKGVMVLSVPINSTSGLIGITRLSDKKIKLGDVLIAINNNEINNPQELLDILENFKPGDKINVTLIRNGKQISKEIVLTTYKTKSYTNMEIDIPINNISPQITPRLRI